MDFLNNKFIYNQTKNDLFKCNNSCDQDVFRRENKFSLFNPNCIFCTNPFCREGKMFGNNYAIMDSYVDNDISYLKERKLLNSLLYDDCQNQFGDVINFFEKESRKPYFETMFFSLFNNEDFLTREKILSSILMSNIDIFNGAWYRDALISSISSDNLSLSLKANNIYNRYKKQFNKIR